MNKVFLTGNLTANPEFKISSKSEIAVATFTIAVKRNISNEVDFINVTCFRKLAELVNKFSYKGQKVLVLGELQLQKYQAKDGSNRYATVIIANEIEFLTFKEEKSTVETVEKMDLPFPVEQTKEDDKIRQLELEIELEKLKKNNK